MFFYFLISILVIVIDQLSKLMIVKNLSLGETIPVIPSFFDISSQRNNGAAWSILEGKMWFFYIITIIVIVVIIYYLFTLGKRNRLMAISLSFMLGGAVGNFIDRIVRKEVVDFIEIHIFSYDYPVFNIADSALTIGVIMLIITMFVQDRKSKEK